MMGADEMDAEDEEIGLIEYREPLVYVLLLLNARTGFKQDTNCAQITIERHARNSQSSQSGCSGDNSDNGAGLGVCSDVLLPQRR